MHEILPIAAGVIAGLIALRLQPGGLRIATLIVLAVGFGVMATVVSGEALVSWGFVSVDFVLVLVSALVTAGLATLWQRQSRLF
jgi:hypothetical protein